MFSVLLEDILDDSRTGLDLDALDRKMRLVARRLDLRLRQVLALPMSMGSTILGLIFVFRVYQSETTANDRQVFQSFADQAAIAVHNARLYENIREEQQRLAAILEYSADGLMILDSRQIIQRFNRALSRMSGWSEEAAVGQLHDAVIVFKSVDYGEPLGAALAHGWPHNPSGSGAGGTGGTTPAAGNALYVQGELLRPDGSLLSVGVTYAPLRDERGDLRNVIVTVGDITHFRRTEEAQSTFISVVSHELKTPVALIKGYAETLSRDDARWDMATIRQSLAVITDEADRLSGLIENLLAASRLQADGMRLTHIDDVDLADVARRAVERFRTQTQKHSLHADFPPGFPAIQGDEGRLRQVMDNLLGNAIKYSPQGGQIQVSGTFDPERVTVTITDQGIGLPKDEQDRIFERFYRVDSTLSRKTQGTGLGLYLSRAIIEAHGGTIQVASEPGKGAAFSLTLPREQPQSGHDRA